MFSSRILPRKASLRSFASDQPDDYNHVFDLSPSKPKENDSSIRELNDALEVLVGLFPDVQPDVFREMLTRVSPESRTEIVAEQLLKHDAEYIQGRYRRSLTKLRIKKPVSIQKRGDSEEVKGDLPILRREERFRTEGYKQKVEIALYDEFRSLSHASIKAVMAENNYHYTSTRLALLDVASKSWRASFANFFMQRKTPSVDKHPFLEWPLSKHKGIGVPRLRHTGNAELDHELEHTLIHPARQREREAQHIVDNALAHQLAGQEAEDAEEEYDCEVCYTTVPIHQVSVCDDGLHFICFRCISHTITEAIYGQGWPRSISNARGTMKCVAPILDNSEDCKGCIPVAIVRLALADKETRGESTLQKFEQRLVTNTLQDTKLSLASCPFCSYAEVDDLTPNRGLHWRFRDLGSVQVPTFWAFLGFLALGGVFLLLFALSLIMGFGSSPHVTPRNMLHPALLRLARKSRGLRFTCRSPSCAKRSCLRCNSLWRDPHSCYSTQLSTLQKSVEAAQTAAVKRVCPKCNLSFVKSSGCNKLVCPCGYKMCYLCRAEIVIGPGSAGGYEHFCQHFRVAGGKCLQCDKCELYKDEDEKEILRLAREKAESEWKVGEGKDVTVKLDIVETLVRPTSGWSQLYDARCWQVWLDAAIERLVVVEVD